ncbi:hypothetical protein [Clostridium isatidis]|uniref:Uncharacterized protein n=1 Tax=Clostridium isatidis TaxID=182773 RepID=A0A343JAE0_9CLOT|nr:hypothetical protein [Clostridium isatidis]ASW42498.1 hypothetical protein BEN51_03085 [Clostridium isatidis]
MRSRKPKIRMEWCYYFDGTKKKRLNVKNIEKEDYIVKYRGKLTCIEGCDARIKFTPKKNGKNFLSTWNKEGSKHKLNCPYHINYNNVVNRKKLIEEEKKVKPNDIQIQSSLKRKLKNLLLEFNEADIPKEKLSTSEINNIGVGKAINKIVDKDGVSDKEASQRITYMEAETINMAYNELWRGVIGNVDNVQTGLTDGVFWGYINLKNQYNRTNIYFPEAYYEGNEFKANNLEKTLNIIKESCNGRENNIIITCYGEIKHKKNTKNDYNINIINPMHILVNGMTMDEILNTGKIKEL